MKVVLSEGGKLRKVSVRKLLKDYDPLLKKICFKWKPSFYFDNSISHEDLVQELKLKLFNDLGSYDHTRGSLITFIKKVANNFFINKRSRLLIDERYPLTSDKSVLYIHSIYDVHEGGGNGEPVVCLLDVLPNNDLDPEYACELKELIEEVRARLDKIRYAPKTFIRRRKSFVLKIFDMILDGDKKLNDHVMFNHRCRMRTYLNNQTSRKPNQITPNIYSIATALKVDTRTIHKAFKLIRMTIFQAIESKYYSSRGLKNAIVREEKGIN